MRGASGAAGAADYTLSLRYAATPFGSQRRLSGKGRFISFAPFVLDFDAEHGSYTVVGTTKDATAESTWRLIRETGAIGQHTAERRCDCSSGRAGTRGTCDEHQPASRARGAAQPGRHPDDNRDAPRAAHDVVLRGVIVSTAPRLCQNAADASQFPLRHCATAPYRADVGTVSLPGGVAMFSLSLRQLRQLRHDRAAAQS